MDRQTFLANVVQSGLVPEDDLGRLLPQLADADGGKGVARALVGLGALTRFQAERLLAGRTLGFFPGPYRILDQIGRGGTGRVYRAEHCPTGRLVALKMLSGQLLKADRAREAFLREVRALTDLVHPNIVAAYDAGDVAGRFYIVLELVEGPNLDHLVRDEGPLAVARACDYVRQVALGLDYANNFGVVHRDIKPANLLVQRRGPGADSPGVVKISDFGLARLHHPGASRHGTNLAGENTVMGTPDYVSPEQARCLDDADIRSDLYSLGCTFYYLLTGRVPFPGGTTIDKLIRHNTDPAPAVTEICPDVGAPVARVVAKLLAKAAADRFQTPAQLAKALAPFAAAGPTRRTPPATPSASTTDTVPASPLGTFDFTAEARAAPGSPSGLTPAVTTPADRQPAKQTGIVGKVLGRLRRAFGR
jgi:serine/threonine-protein kinase